MILKPGTKKFLIILFVIVAIAFFILLFKIIIENSECTSNPLVYGANRIIGKDGEPLYASCSCSGTGWSFWFDGKGIYKDSPLLNERGNLFNNES